MYNFFEFSKIVIIILLLLTFSFSINSQDKSIKLKYLGAAGWEIINDEIVVLIDPYITRFEIEGYGTDDPEIQTYKWNDIFISDTLMIDKIIKKADYIFIHHSHFDHLGDVPYIAKMTGAKVIGSESTCAILFSYGIPTEQLYPILGGEDYQFEHLSVRVIPSLHSTNRTKHYIDTQTYKYKDRVNYHPLTTPLRIDEFVEGGSFMYFIRFSNHHTILTNGSENFIERELEGIEPYIHIMGTHGPNSHIYNYYERLLKVTNYPKYVLPTHWDRWSLPYTRAQSVGIERMKQVGKKIKAISPETNFVIPKHLEIIEIR